MEHEREFGVVLFGATGYTGRLVAEHLLTRKQGVRLAFAGRNQAKLEQLRSELGAEDVPLLVGDVSDEGFLQRMAENTAVVCTTVGPYARYGAGLVAACAAAGTSYCDLTGETHFIRDMIDRYGAAAAQSGARLVHCCGFDSIPADLGVFFLQEQAQARLGGPCQEVRAFLTDMSGTFSGGTMSSMEQLLDDARRDPALRSLLLDPYALNPAGERSGADGRDPLGPAHDPDMGWTAPFIMATANTRIVRRSNAIMNYPYGRDFRYTETIATGKGAKGWVTAQALTVGTGALIASMAVPPIRTLTASLRPKPGEGPSKTQREQGHFTYDFLGKRDSTTLRVQVHANVDPGYGATARMLGESALCLAQDTARLPVQGGSWTPASALGHALIDRLNAVGVEFRVLA